MGLVEKLVTPISLQKHFSKSKEELKRKRRREKIVLAVAGILVVVLVGNSVIGSMNQEEKTITIGSKDFTEQLILCNMYADIIEHDTDITVVRQENLGGTQVCYEAMKKGEIDMYVDYTGTIYVDVLKHEAKPDMEAVYNECVEEMYENDNIVILEQAGFNNTYTLAVSKETAEKYGLETMEDLQKCDSELTLGATLEFLNRPDDGLPGLETTYDIEFKDAVGIDGSPRFTALENGEVDIVNAFATDGLLKKYDLTILEDNFGLLPSVLCGADDQRGNADQISGTGKQHQQAEQLPDQRGHAGAQLQGGRRRHGTERCSQRIPGVRRFDIIARSFRKLY